MNLLMIHELNNTIMQMVGVLLLIMIFMMLVLPLTIGKYFDQWFGDINPPLTIIFSPFKGFGRAQYYSMCVIHKNRSSSRRLEPYYQGFDFREHARTSDIIISYIFYCSIVITLSLGLIWYMLSFF